MNRQMNFIKKYIIFENKFYNIVSKIELENVDQVRILINNISEFLVNMSKISDKGYVNLNNINLPIFIWLLREYNASVKVNCNTNYSIQLNTIYYNLFLLLLLLLVIKVKQCYLEFIIEDKDLNTDVSTLYSNILNKIDPKYRSKIRNKGLSIILNSYVGFDSEYDLKSSINKTNNLLSVQLAGRSGTVVKIPVVEQKSVNKDFKIMNWSEANLLKICINSLDMCILNIRNLLYKDSDDYLKDLLIELHQKGYNKIESDDYITFLMPYSDVKSVIIVNEKYFNKEEDYYFKNSNNKDVLNELDSTFVDESYVKNLDLYGSKELIKDSNSLNNHLKSLYDIFYLLNNRKELSSKLIDSIERSSKKSLSRITYRNGNVRLSITINKHLYLCMHESAADLSMLCDFKDFKEQLDIVARSFVTLGKPLSLEYCDSKVHFRDTVLLAPMGAKSLASLGSIYGEEFKKVDIGSYRNGRMSELLKNDLDLFIKYSIQDSLITLKHVISMTDFYTTVGRTGVPLSISGIGKAYVLEAWKKDRYDGYQPREDYIIGNFTDGLTPKGARSVGISNFIVPFVSSYRGGRNESFMYGTDVIKDKRSWFDYDLTSCYTTVMSILGHPDYDNAVYLFNKTVSEFSNNTFLLNYISLDVDFKFPVNIKYPCIPTRVDDDVDIYPREGRSTITGIEYLVAKLMGCKLYVRSGVMIPFKNIKDNKESYIKDYISPYKNIVKNLQLERRRHPKKTFYNYMYKEIGNSIYGNIAMGISGKKTFDVKSQTSKKVLGSVLSNPILASYITGFTRALIGECLYNIQMLKGNVISVTTDGFITDLSDLEEKILFQQKNNINCLSLYRNTRKFLTTFENTEPDCRGLEIKNVEETGIISCKTRVQLGFTDGGISASTGFQSRGLERTFLIEEFSKILNSTDRTIEYIQTGLRSAKDIYDKGGHVMAKYSDKAFCFDYDNKRRIIENGSTLLDSVPWSTVKKYEKIRVLKNTLSKPVFQKFFTVSKSNGYKSFIETSVRAFIKGCLSDKNNYGIPKGYFKGYKEIIDFIYGHEPAREVKLSLSSISRLKLRNTISRAVPRTTENISFITYVKKNIAEFNDTLFFKELSQESVRLKKSVAKDAKKLSTECDHIKEGYNVRSNKTLSQVNNSLLLNNFGSSSSFSKGTTLNNNRNYSTNRKSKRKSKNSISKNYFSNNIDNLYYNHRNYYILKIIKWHLHPNVLLAKTIILISMGCVYSNWCIVGIYVPWIVLLIPMHPIAYVMSIEIFYKGCTNIITREFWINLIIGWLTLLFLRLYLIYIMISLHVLLGSDYIDFYLISTWLTTSLLQALFPDININHIWQFINKKLSENPTLTTFFVKLLSYIIKFCRDYYYDLLLIINKPIENPYNVKVKEKSLDKVKSVNIIEKVISSSNRGLNSLKFSLEDKVKYKRSFIIKHNFVNKDSFITHKHETLSNIPSKWFVEHNIFYKNSLGESYLKYCYKNKLNPNNHLKEFKAFSESGTKSKNSSGFCTTKNTTVSLKNFYKDTVLSEEVRLRGGSGMPMDIDNITTYSSSTKTSSSIDPLAFRHYPITRKDINKTTFAKLIEDHGPPIKNNTNMSYFMHAYNMFIRKDFINTDSLSSDSTAIDTRYYKEVVFNELPNADEPINSKLPYYKDPLFNSMFKKYLEDRGIKESFEQYKKFILTLIGVKDDYTLDTNSPVKLHNNLYLYIKENFFDIGSHYLYHNLLENYNDYVAKINNGTSKKIIPCYVVSNDSYKNKDFKCLLEYLCNLHKLEPNQPSTNILLTIHLNMSICNKWFNIYESSASRVLSYLLSHYVADSTTLISSEDTQRNRKKPDLVATKYYQNGVSRTFLFCEVKRGSVGPQGILDQVYKASQTVKESYIDGEGRTGCIVILLMDTQLVFLESFWFTEYLENNYIPNYRGIIPLTQSLPGYNNYKSELWTKMNSSVDLEGFKFPYKHLERKIVNETPFCGYDLENNPEVVHDIFLYIKEVKKPRDPNIVINTENIY